MSTDTLRNVPVEKVSEVVQSFLDDGATRIIINKNNDTFDIEATIPG